MVESQPWWLQGLCYTAEEFRQHTNAFVCSEGVVDIVTDLKVTTTGQADHSVVVANGMAFIQGDDDTTPVETPDQGMYRIRRSDATPEYQLDAGGGGNPRIDMIVATVRDQEYSGLDNDWIIQIVKGTATAGAQVIDPDGANYHAGVAAVPNNSYVLAYIRVPSADTLGTIIAAVDIEDARNGYGRCGTFPYIELEAAGPAGTALGTAVATKIDLATVVHIDPEAFTLAASVVTIVESGWYDVSGWALITSGTADTKIVTLTRSAAPTNIASAGGANLTTTYSSPNAHQVFLAAGTTVQLQGFATTAGTSTFHDANNKSRLVIRKVG